MSRNYLERLEYLDSLIRKDGTGSPSQLAEKLHLGKRAVYDYIKLLKRLGAPISYDRVRETYYYREPGQFSFRFVESKDEENVSE